MATHTWNPGRIHHEWDLDLEPALAIESGDTVLFDIPMAGESQVTFGASIADCSFDFDTIYNLAGPIEVRGAELGDTLRVDILSLETGAWGWCVILPGVGLLPDYFPDGYVRTFSLDDGPIAFGDGIAIPKTPFFGTMGNHPGEPRKNVPFPPHRGGGNMDNRHLQQGATLWLPVHVPGAHFSVGDPHACQGDGEVCVAALECPMRAALKFTLEKRPVSCPQWRSPGALTSRTDSGGYHGTMGIADDLMEAARMAVRSMIGWLGDEHALAPQDAYMLCSLAGDLKIIEIVDSGVWNVGMTMPLALFNRQQTDNEDSPEATAGKALAAASGNEVRSIDSGPHQECHGKGCYLEGGWSSGNAGLTATATGQLAISLDGNLNCTWIALFAARIMATFVAALHSLHGEQLDLPQMTQYWAQFGYLDVAVLVLSFMVSKHAGYIVLNSLLARLLKISAQ